MRDKKRIKIILALIEKKWNEVPDQRFGQLLINLRIVKDDLILWQTEDDRLEEYLKSLK